MPRTRPCSQPAGPARPEAGRRIRWLRHSHRPSGHRRRIGPRPVQHPSRPSRLDGAGARRTVHLAYPCRGPPGAPASRSASVRDQRRGPNLGASRRPDPCRPSGGEPRRQLEPRGRFQGHLGHCGPWSDAHSPPARSRVGRNRGTVARGERYPSRSRPRLGRSRTGPAATTAATTERAVAHLLSRIAEGLFWTGRYVERAEDTARISMCISTTCSRRQSRAKRRFAALSWR